MELGSTVSDVRLTVLGGFRLTVAGAEAPALPLKARALLAYLAAQGGRRASRETLGELLWSGRGAAQVGHSLRQALFDLRYRLARHGVIAVREGDVLLDPSVACDLHDFLSGAGAGDRAGLAAAAAAYTGPLLDGFSPLANDFEDWLTLTRARLQNHALDVLGRLATLCTEAGDPAAALAAIERMFALDPLREDIHRRLLEACAAAGRRAEAMRYYEQIVAILRRDLGIAPARETRELAQRLRREMDPLPEDATPAPAFPVPRTLGPPIAVLPFRQIGAEAVPSHLHQGLVTDIVCQLAGLRELSVISHGSTLGLQDGEQDPRAVGRMLGARYVVRGAMVRLGALLRLTTELADAETGMVVWARTHETSASVTFADQDRVVAQIVNTLAPRVRDIELQRIRGSRPESLSTYDKVLLAREHLMVMERDSFLTAKTLLDEVVAAEPGYADAYALAADWHSLFMSQGWTSDRIGHLGAVERLARQALTLDGDNVRALIFYGHRRSLLHRDYDGARALFGHALEVAPSSAHGWLWSSYTYSYLGDAEEALRRAGRALELSPRDRNAHDFYSALCVAHYTAGNYADAVEWGEKALGEKNSVLSATLGWTAAAYAGMGKPEAASHLARRAAEAIPDRRVRDVVARHPYKEAHRREAYGAHLVAAGFPP